MKSGASTATTVDLFKTNLKSTGGGTTDLSKTAPKEKDKEKTKGKSSSLKKASPYGALLKSSSAGSKSKTEAQGPIDWTHLGIKLKYRGEKQREHAWEIWKSSIGDAKKMLEDFNEILPVVKVERHPMYSLYFKRVADENYESNTRTKSRLLMKKFILDVQELWLTNLQHLREHQPGKMTAIKDEDEEEAENYMRGTGLDHRRDVKELAGMQHQVQSVSQKRAFAQAYHTSRMPPPKVKLDYKPGSTPKLPPPKPVVPIIESLAATLSYSRSSPSDTMYSFMDDAVVNSTDSVALHVDRLLPSHDFSTFIAPDVFWRLTALHSVTLAKRVFLVPETTVAMYAAHIINADLSGATSDQSSAVHTVYENRRYLPIPYLQDVAAEQNVIEWQGNIVIQVSQQASTSNLAPIRITVMIEVEPVEHIQELYRQQPPSDTYLTDQSANQIPGYQFMMQLSPLECRLLLHRADIPLFDLSWWSDAQRSGDIWEKLVPMLRLEATKDSQQHTLITSAAAKNYARQPVGLQITDPHGHRRYDGFKPSAWKRYTQSDDMLSTLQAASCLYEVLPYFRMIIDSDVAAHGPGSGGVVPVIRLPHRADDVPAPSFTEVQSVDGKYPYDSIGIDASPQNHYPHPNYDWKGEAKSYFHSGRWEKLLEQGVNASLQANLGIDRIYYVPGASEVGRKGLWFPDEMDPTREKTQVGALFFRDPMKSSTNSILVNLTLVLDTSLKFKSQTAWENYSQLPVAAIGEEANGVIPMVTIKPRRILDHIEVLDSPIEKRLSSAVTIFSSAAIEGVDYYPRDYESFVPPPQRPKGFRRYVPTKNKYGYREQIEVTLLNIDPVVDATTFGITQQGAIPNTPGVNPRNIWHNMVAVNEHICRPRISKDYHYIVTNLNHCGANIPTSYTTRMKALEMVGLTSSAFKAFEDAYAKIQELRNVFTKQLALESKIEKVTNDLKVKEAMTVRMLQKKLQRQLERKLKKSTKSEEGWKRRYNASSLVEVQGNWERRRDDRNGLLFFHKLEHPSTYSQQVENYGETCQWDVPAEWDGEFWKIRNPAYVGSAPRFVGSSADGLLSKNDTIDSQYPFHTGDTVVANGKSYHNPIRTVPQHLQNISVEHAGQTSTAMLQRQTEEQRGFHEPRSDWHPAASNSNSLANQPPNVPSLFTSSNSKPPTHPSNTHSHQQQPHQQQQHQHQQREDDDAMSELNSARADRSIADSIAPTIDTVNLEHIAEQLISSDEIMRIIAKRLGIPEQQVVPADELSSVFTAASQSSSSQAGSRVLYAPRDPVDHHPLQQQHQQQTRAKAAGAIDYDSDEDLWSDEEEEVGDVDYAKELARDEDMPQDQLEMAKWKRRLNVEAMELNDLHHGTHSSGIDKNKNKSNKGGDIASVPSQVPYLDLREVLGGETNAEVEANQRRYNWRRLPRPVIKDNFLTHNLKTHVRGPDPTSCNTLNTPIFLMPISPVDACHYVPEAFAMDIESIFIPNAKKDMERSIATLDRNIKREEELARNIPTEDLLLFGEAKEFTSVEMFLAKQYKADKAQVADPQDAAKERAILAAKATNIAQMEDALAEDIPINTADQFGNTLLILAAQQGSRRMCKFLLRRGANINMQNLSGNTALHYCYAYGNKPLGEYLKNKGANDAIINVDGLTCYEGLSRDAMAEFYGDFEEDDYEDAGQSRAQQHHNNDHSDDEDEDDEDDDHHRGHVKGGGQKQSHFDAMDVSQLGDSTVGY